MKPRMPVTTNDARQPNCSARNATSGGASTAPTAEPPSNIAIAKARRFCGNQLATALVPAGQLPASVTPSRERATIRLIGPTTKACSTAATDRNTLRPKLPDGATELFQPSDDDGERITYTPAILRSATVMFDDAKRKISGRSMVTLVNEIDIEKQKVLWDKFVDVPKDDDLSKYESEPKENAAYADLPAPALKTTTYTSIKKDFTDWVFANHSLELFFSPLLEVYSNPGEKQDEFKVRITQTTREQRDAAIEELRSKTAKTMKALQDKAEKAASKVDVQQAQSSSAKMSTLVEIGGSLLGMFMGRKTSIVKASTVNSASRVWKEGADVKAAQSELDSLKADMAELEKQIADDTQKIRDQYDPATLAFETFKLSPMKKNIQVTATGILWLAK